MKKMVSVIMPVFNCGAFLADAVQSVLAQTYQDYEMIIIDDGSTDDTRGMAERYAAEQPGKIVCLHRSNRGPGAARNAGIRHSTGNYIAFLDCDDVWLPEKLARQVEHMERDGRTGLLYCDNYFVGRDRRILQGYRRRVGFHRGMVAPELFQHYFIITSGVMVRRECLETAGLFREDIRTGEDYDLFLRIAYRSRVDWIDEKLYERRAVQESMSNQDDRIIMSNDLEVLTRFVNERPEFYVRHKKMVRERLGAYYLALGYYSLKAGWNGYGARNLLRSLRYRFSAKALKCILMSAFPYEMLKSFKERGAQRSGGKQL